ncbi:hypothetical protein GCM10027280_15270 [Micromonospora polyrhachis]
MLIQLGTPASAMLIQLGTPASCTMPSCFGSLPSFGAATTQPPPQAVRNPQIGPMIPGDRDPATRARRAAIHKIGTSNAVTPGGCRRR